MRFPRLFPFSRSAVIDPLGTYPPPQAKDIILFVTDRCNMRCEHCMFWQRIDDPGPEMTLVQFQQIARTAPALRTVSITGGEPFLRNDLDEIVESFYRENRTHNVQINTNGLLWERMEHLIELDLAAKYEHFLSFQVSIDGLEKNHDRLRQLPGSFRKITNNLKRLVALTKEHPYFRVVVLTNVNKHNYREIDELSHFLWDEIGVQHAFDLVRGVTFSSWGIPQAIIEKGDPRDCDLPPMQELEGILDAIRRINRREGGHFDQFVRQLEVQVGLYLGIPAPFRCLSAGRTAGVIYGDGSVAACEFTKPFAHLADFDYDLDRLWRSRQAELRRNQITGCSCSHTCFVLTSLVEWEEQQNRKEAG
ncbi:MAG: radical SAM protein [Candidatus Omnitrophota bacterium]|nr:MAG: radical SAM protein [Candidatus Omnitrophota bacterium]